MTEHLLLREELTVDDVIMMPQFGMLNSRSDAVLHQYMYSAPMDRVTGYNMAKAMLDVGQVPVVSRFLSDEERQRCLKDFHDTEAFFAVGATKNALAKFIKELADLKVDELLINVAVDIAHGDSNIGYHAVKFLNDQPFVHHIMTGSVVSGAGASFLVQGGASHVRVGIGPGSMCTTRVMTGCGRPQLSAVYDVKSSLDLAGQEAVVIADGGIRNPGDVVKYLCAGADAVMLGSELARAFESPGWHEMETQLTYEGAAVMIPSIAMPKKWVKTYRGQASAEFQAEMKPEGLAYVEGVRRDMEWDGSTVESITTKYDRGLRSAISYLGGTSLENLNPVETRMLRITAAGRREGESNGR